MRLVVHDVTFRHPRGDRDVLKNLSCDIPSGSSVAIIGPSGSGKTTLLSLLGGLLEPQSGGFYCEDASAKYVPRDVATWVLQTVSVLPERSVLDNVALGAHMDGATSSEAHVRAMNTIRLMGLAGREHESTRILSGGELQRVAIARALTSRRPLLLADEPTGQLDAATTTSVLDAMFAAAGRTVVLVTHDESAADRCDMVLRLSNGQLHDDRVATPIGAA